MSSEISYKKGGEKMKEQLIRKAEELGFH